MPAELPDAIDAIRGAGLRVTDSRRAVLDALEGHAHLSADELFQRVVQRVPRTSLQSVYNALGDFVEAGLVRRIEPAGRPGLFERRVDDNHHHLICSGCGRVQDVDCAVGHAPCLTPSNTHGFRLDVAEVTFWGVCAECAASDSSAHPLSLASERNPHA